MSTVETPVEAALTKDDIKALRIADDVHARRSPGPESQLEAILDSSKRGQLFEGTDRLRRVIPTRDRMTIYKGGGCINHDNADNVSAFAFTIGGKYCEEWQTIAGLLRAGDELTLEWIAGNNSQYLDAATGRVEHSDGGSTGFSGLHHDAVHLSVRRNDKPKYRFYLADSICPNNTARMIGQGE